MKEIILKHHISPIVAQTLIKMGYTIVDKSETVKYIWWDGTIQPQDFLGLTSVQHINKIPNMDVICYKSTLSQSLLQMKTIFPNHYSFFPQSFLLPQQYNELKKMHCMTSERTKKPVTWIMKPQNGCCGKGIQLIQTLGNEIRELTTPTIVQEYITPYLVRNHKFDFRFYILIFNIKPLRILIYKEGLARFCTHVYVNPNAQNLHDKFVHITNTAVNIENHSNSFQDFTRLSSDVLKEINSENLWKEIKNVCALTIIATYPEILKSIATSEVSHRFQNPYSHFFHLVGIDIMINHLLHPIVIELNDRPSMKVQFQCEEKLKSNLIRDTMILIESQNIPAYLPPLTINSKSSPHFQKKQMTKTKLLINSKSNCSIKGSLSKTTSLENSDTLHLSDSKQTTNETESQEFRSTGWEEIYPLEGTEEGVILSTIQQKALTLFCPKDIALPTGSYLKRAHQIVYPKFNVDRNKLKFLFP